MTYDGRMIRGGEELKSYEIGDGSTVQVTSRIRGGGRLKDRKIKEEETILESKEPRTSARTSQ